ncbi:MAG: hypothetical protein U9N50_13440 [Pseudomonadota bacterium]|nr:hypothetical protein [Pseudomonadota bacterium]
MTTYKTVLVSLLLLLLTSCVTDNEISQEELEKQNKVSEIISAVLFDNDLDSLASYNIRRSGFVVIIFDESVADEKYRKVVDLLRSNAVIKGVRAKQNGVEICGLP